MDTDIWTTFDTIITSGGDVMSVRKVVYDGDSKYPIAVEDTAGRLWMDDEIAYYVLGKPTHAEFLDALGDEDGEKAWQRWMDFG